MQWLNIWTLKMKVMGSSPPIYNLGLPKLFGKVIYLVYYTFVFNMENLG
jgi:hypothetical protein